MCGRDAQLLLLFSHGYGSEVMVARGLCRYISPSFTPHTEVQLCYNCKSGIVLEKSSDILNKGLY